MTSYLIFPNLTAAQARSHTQALAKGCQGETEYWWAQITNPNGRAALVIEDSGDYGPEGLTIDEIAALVPAANMDLSWFPPGN